MKYLLVLILLVCPFSIISCASMSSRSNVSLNNMNIIKKDIAQKNNKKDVDIYYKGKYVGSMSYPEYESMVRATTDFSEIKEAEKSGRVKIEILDDPWQIHIGETFKTKIIIRWFAKDKTVIKKIVLQMKILRSSEKRLRSMEYYGYVAKVGFPITAITTVIMIVLIILL